jgi:hypothetical protein
MTNTKKKLHEAVLPIIKFSSLKIFKTTSLRKDMSISNDKYIDVIDFSRTTITTVVNDRIRTGFSVETTVPSSHSSHFPHSP